MVDATTTRGDDQAMMIALAGPNIWQRVRAVQKAVGYVQKDASVQGYRAVSHDAVTARVRGAMIENGIGMLPTRTDAPATITQVGETRQGAPIIRYEATFLVSFINVDLPTDRIDVLVEAHANDHGDKGPGKAMSYAVKMAEIKIFLIESGDQEESRYQDEELAPPPKPQLPLNADPDLIDWYDANSDKVPHDYTEHVIALWPSIKAIHDGFATEDMGKAAEAWFELNNDEKQYIWRAPTKGGVFTTEQRNIMKTKEFREAAG